jgi:tripartite-type tricarboxylate transporter receptor subunit TctC
VHFGNSSDILEPVKSGEVKALAVSTLQRIPQLPDVPTVAETVPGFEYVAWNGYAAAGSSFPQDVAGRLVEALQTIAREPEIVRLFANLGIVSVGTTQQEAMASVRRDMPTYAKIVDMAGVRLK